MYAARTTESCKHCGITVRLAVRGRLADVVRRPVVTTPDPATAGPYETDEGDRP